MWRGRCAMVGAAVEGDRSGHASGMMCEGPVRVSRNEGRRQMWVGSGRCTGQRWGRELLEGTIHRKRRANTHAPEDAQFHISTRQNHSREKVGLPRTNSHQAHPPRPRDPPRMSARTHAIAVCMSSANVTARAPHPRPGESVILSNLGLNMPAGMAFGPRGDLMICDYGNKEVVRLYRDGAKVGGDVGGGPAIVSAALAVNPLCRSQPAPCVDWATRTED